MKYIQHSLGSPIKDIIHLVKDADGSKIFVNRLAKNRLSWYFNRDSSWKIYPNITIEVSTNPFCWPRLCVFKENNLVKMVIAANKISFWKKLQLFLTIRKFSKKMRPDQDVSAYVEHNLANNDITVDHGINYYG